MELLVCICERSPWLKWRHNTEETHYVRDNYLGMTLTPHVICSPVEKESRLRKLNDFPFHKIFLQFVFCLRLQRAALSWLTFKDEHYTSVTYHIIVYSIIIITSRIQIISHTSREISKFTCSTSSVLTCVLLQNPVQAMGGWKNNMQ